MENRELCLGYGSAIELWRQARRRVAAQNPADPCSCTSSLTGIRTSVLTRSRPPFRPA